MHSKNAVIYKDIIGEANPIEGEDDEESEDENDDCGKEESAKPQYVHRRHLRRS